MGQDLMHWAEEEQRADGKRWQRSIPHLERLLLGGGFTKGPDGLWSRGAESMDLEAALRELATPCVCDSGRAFRDCHGRPE